MAESPSRPMARDTSPTTAAKRKQDQTQSPSGDGNHESSEKKQKTQEQITEINETKREDGAENHTSVNSAEGLESTSQKIDEQESAAHKAEANGGTADGAVIAEAREEGVPSSILEKGIIYFFFRGRVGTDDPSKVDEVARSYMVLRPLPHGAKLGDGQIGDAHNCRLLALPKKVLPTSGRDRFLVFVDEVHLSFADLRESFLAGADYATKTAGTRHTPPASPIGEGVYAITSTGRESHLAYILTLPSKLEDVQRDVGLRERGSFIASTKNPQYPSPPNASLPQGPDYPQEVLDEFRSLRWMPTQPNHLNYANAQILLIGEGEHGADKATEPQPEDEKEGKEKPLEEMEKLEGEDQIRVKHLKGDHAVFADLHLDSTEYPKMKSTWQ